MLCSSWKLHIKQVDAKKNLLRNLCFDFDPSENETPGKTWGNRKPQKTRDSKICTTPYRVLTSSRRQKGNRRAVTERTTNYTQTTRILIRTSIREHRNSSA
jgi:hypothetical protein